MTGMTYWVPYYLQVTLRILPFILISTSLSAQTDTLKHDRWIAWITPTSGLHALHPAIEVGVEYSPGNLWAYTLNYGIRSMEKKELHYDDQSHQYIRLGFKKYFVPKFNSGYLMPELGLFHLSHEGRHGNITWKENTQPNRQADARIHDFYLKTGALLGRKMRAREVRCDIFIGGGARFTFRHHKLLNILEYNEDWNGGSSHGWEMPYDNIYIHTPKGWKAYAPVYYLSLGVRLGIGIKPVKVPIEKRN